MSKVKKAIKLVNKRIITLIVLTSMLVVSLAGITYSWFRSSQNYKGVTYETGIIDVSFYGYRVTSTSATLIIPNPESGTTELTDDGLVVAEDFVATLSLLENNESDYYFVVVRKSDSIPVDLRLAWELDGLNLLNGESEEVKIAKKEYISGFEYTVNPVDIESAEWLTGDVVDTAGLGTQLKAHKTNNAIDWSQVTSESIIEIGNRKNDSDKLSLEENNYAIYRLTVKKPSGITVYNDQRFALRTNLTVSQTGALDDQTTATTITVNTAGSLREAIRTYIPGSTIRVTSPIEYSTDLVLDRPVTLMLDSTLTVKGNLVIQTEYAEKQFIIDTRNGGTLRIEEALSGESVGGNFNVNIPKSTLILRGRNNSSTTMGDVYVKNAFNVQTAEESGLYLDKVRIYDTTASTLKTIKLRTGSGVYVGADTTVSTIETYNVAVDKIAIENHGTIAFINASIMTKNDTYTTPSIYIDNYKEITEIKVPWFSVKYSKQVIEDVTVKTGNTRIMNELGAKVPTVLQDTEGAVFNQFKSDGSRRPEYDDIEYIGSEELVIDESAEQNHSKLYVIYADSYAISGDNKITLEMILENYITENSLTGNKSSIKEVRILTDGSNQLTTADLTYIKNNLTGLTSLDLSSAEIVNGSVPASAFSTLSNLETCKLPMNATTLGNTLFSSSTIEIWLPATVTSLSTTTLNNVKYVHLAGETFLSNYTNSSRLIFGKDRTTVTGFGTADSIKLYSFVESTRYRSPVTGIDYFLILNDEDNTCTLTTIGNLTLTNDRFEEEMLGVFKFDFSTITINGKTYDITLIDNQAFWRGYVDVTEFTFAKNKPVIIGENAFRNRTLTTKVTFLNDATLKLSCFEKCSGITEITFKGNATVGSKTFNSAFATNATIECEKDLSFSSGATGAFNSAKCVSLHVKGNYNGEGVVRSTTTDLQTLQFQNSSLKKVLIEGNIDLTYSTAEFQQCYSLQTFEVRGSGKMYYYALRNDTALVNIIMPKVTNVSSMIYADSYIKLKNIDIRSSTTNIYNYSYVNAKLDDWIFHTKITSLEALIGNNSDATNNYFIFTHPEALNGTMPTAGSLSVETEDYTYTFVPDAYYDCYKAYTPTATNRLINCLDYVYDYDLEHYQQTGEIIPSSNSNIYFGTIVGDTTFKTKPDGTTKYDYNCVFGVNEDGTTATILLYYGENAGPLFYNGSSIYVSDGEKQYLVTKIGASSFAKETLNYQGANTKIVIPSNITYIGAYAFYGCTGATGLQADSVEYIGKYAFYGISKLSTFSVGATYIGAYAFYNCGLSGKITIDNRSNSTLDTVCTVGASAFASNTNLTGLEYKTNGSLSLATGIFTSCPSFSSIDVTAGKDVTIAADFMKNNKVFASLRVVAGGAYTISSQAFWECYELSTVYLSSGSGESLIGSTAFYWHSSWGTSKLTSVTITGTGDVAVGASAFESQNQAVFNKVTPIYKVSGSAFGGCSLITEIALNGSKEGSIGVGAFKGTKLKTIIAPNITVLSDHALYPNDLIEVAVFPRLYKIDDISINGGGSFKYLETSMIYEAGGKYSIYQSSPNLVHVIRFDTLPSEYQQVIKDTNTSFAVGFTPKGTVIVEGYKNQRGTPAYAFRNYANVVETGEITSDTWYKCVDKDGKAIPNALLGYTYLASITQNEKTKENESVILYNFSSKTALPSTVKDVNSTKTGTVVGVSNGAFQNADFSIDGENKDLSLPTALTVIPKNAFKGATGIKSIIIRDNITIGESAFENVVLSGSLNIGSGATFGLNAFKNITATNVYIGEVSDLGNKTFDSAKITNLLIDTQSTTKITGTTPFVNVSPAPYVKFPVYVYESTYKGQGNWLSIPEVNIGTYSVKTTIDDVDYYLDEIKSGETITAYELSYIAGDSVNNSTLTLPSTIDVETQTGTVTYDVTGVGVLAFNGLTSASAVTKIVLPSGLTEFKCVEHMPENLTELEIADSNANFKTVDGVLYNKAVTELICYPHSKAGATFTLPTTVTTVKSFAFKGAVNLTTLIVDHAVTFEPNSHDNTVAIIITIS